MGNTHVGVYKITGDQNDRRQHASTGRVADNIRNTRNNNNQKERLGGFSATEGGYAPELVCFGHNRGNNAYPSERPRRFNVHCIDYLLKAGPTPYTMRSNKTPKNMPVGDGNTNDINISIKEDTPNVRSIEPNDTTTPIALDNDGKNLVNNKDKSSSGRDEPLLSRDTPFRLNNSAVNTDSALPPSRSVHGPTFFDVPISPQIPTIPNNNQQQQPNLSVNSTTSIGINEMGTPQNILTQPTLPINDQPQTGNESSPNNSTKSMIHKLSGISQVPVNGAITNKPVDPNKIDTTKNIIDTVTDKPVSSKDDKPGIEAPKQQESSNNELPTVKKTESKTFSNYTPPKNSIVPIKRPLTASKPLSPAISKLQPSPSSTITNDVPRSSKNRLGLNTEKPIYSKDGRRGSDTVVSRSLKQHGSKSPSNEDGIRTGQNLRTGSAVPNDQDDSTTPTPVTVETDTVPLTDITASGPTSSKELLDSGSPTSKKILDSAPNKPIASKDLASPGNDGLQTGSLNPVSLKDPVLEPGKNNSNDTTPTNEPSRDSSNKPNTSQTQGVPTQHQPNLAASDETVNQNPINPRTPTPNEKVSNTPASPHNKQQQEQPTLPINSMTPIGIHKTMQEAPVGTPQIQNNQQQPTLQTGNESNFGGQTSPTIPSNILPVGGSTPIQPSTNSTQITENGMTPENDQNAPIDPSSKKNESDNKIPPKNVPDSESNEPKSSSNITDFATNTPFSQTEEEEPISLQRKKSSIGKRGSLKNLPNNSKGIDESGSRKESTNSTPGSTIKQTISPTETSTAKRTSSLIKRTPSSKIKQSQGSTDNPTPSSAENSTAKRTSSLINRSPSSTINPTPSTAGKQTPSSKIKQSPDLIKNPTTSSVENSTMPSSIENSTIKQTISPTENPTAKRTPSSKIKQSPGPLGNPTSSVENSTATSIENSTAKRTSSSINRTPSTSTKRTSSSKIKQSVGNPTSSVENSTDNSTPDSVEKSKDNPTPNLIGNSRDNSTPGSKITQSPDSVGNPMTSSTDNPTPSPTQNSTAKRTSSLINRSPSSTGKQTPSSKIKQSPGSSEHPTTSSVGNSTDNPTPSSIENSTITQTISPTENSTAKRTPSLIKRSPSSKIRQSSGSTDNPTPSSVENSTDSPTPSSIENSTAKRTSSLINRSPSSTIKPPTPGTAGKQTPSSKIKQSPDLIKNPTSSVENSTDNSTPSSIENLRDSSTPGSTRKQTLSSKIKQSPDSVGNPMTNSTDNTTPSSVEKSTDNSTPDSVENSTTKVTPSSTGHATVSSKNKQMPSSTGKQTPSSKIKQSPGTIKNPTTSSVENSIDNSTPDSVEKSTDNPTPSSIEDSTDNSTPGSTGKRTPSSKIKQSPDLIRNATSSTDNSTPDAVENSTDNSTPHSVENSTTKTDKMTPSSTGHATVSSKNKQMPSSTGKQTPSSKIKQSPESIENPTTSSPDNPTPSSVENSTAKRTSSLKNRSPSSTINPTPSSTGKRTPSSKIKQSSGSTGQTPNLLQNSKDNPTPSSIENSTITQTISPTENSTAKTTPKRTSSSGRTTSLGNTDRPISEKNGLTKDKSKNTPLPGESKSLKRQGSFKDRLGTGRKANDKVGRSTSDGPTSSTGTGTDDLTNDKITSTNDDTPKLKDGSTEPHTTLENRGENTGNNKDELNGPSSGRSTQNPLSNSELNNHPTPGPESYVTPTKNENNRNGPAKTFTDSATDAPDSNSIVNSPVTSNDPSSVLVRDNSASTLDKTPTRNKNNSPILETNSHEPVSQSNNAPDSTRTNEAPSRNSREVETSADGDVNNSPRSEDVENEPGSTMNVSTLNGRPSPINNSTQSGTATKNVPPTGRNSITKKSSAETPVHSRRSLKSPLKSNLQNNHSSSTTNGQKTQENKDTPTSTNITGVDQASTNNDPTYSGIKTPLRQKSGINVQQKYHPKKDSQVTKNKSIPSLGDNISNQPINNTTLEQVPSSTQVTGHTVDKENTSFPHHDDNDGHPRNLSTQSSSQNPMYTSKTPLNRKSRPSPPRSSIFGLPASSHHQQTPLHPSMKKTSPYRSSTLLPPTDLGRAKNTKQTKFNNFVNPFNDTDRSGRGGSSTIRSRPTQPAHRSRSETVPKYLNNTHEEWNVGDDQLFYRAIATAAAEAARLERENLSSRRRPHTFCETDNISPNPNLNDLLFNRRANPNNFFNSFDHTSNRSKSANYRDGRNKNGTGSPLYDDERYQAYLEYIRDRLTLFPDRNMNQVPSSPSRIRTRNPNPCNLNDLRSDFETLVVDRERELRRPRSSLRGGAAAMQNCIPSSPTCSVASSSSSSCSSSGSSGSYEEPQCYAPNSCCYQVYHSETCTPQIIKSDGSDLFRGSDQNDEKLKKKKVPTLADTLVDENNNTITESSSENDSENEAPPAHPTQNLLARPPRPPTSWDLTKNMTRKINRCFPESEKSNALPCLTNKKLSLGSLTNKSFVIKPKNQDNEYVDKCIQDMDRLTAKSTALLSASSNKNENDDISSASDFDDFEQTSSITSTSTARSVRQITPPQNETAYDAEDEDDDSKCLKGNSTTEHFPNHAEQNTTTASTRLRQLSVNLVPTPCLASKLSELTSSPLEFHSPLITYLRSILEQPGSNKNSNSKPSTTPTTENKFQPIDHQNFVSVSSSNADDTEKMTEEASRDLARQLLRQLELEHRSEVEDNDEDDEDAEDEEDVPSDDSSFVSILIPTFTLRNQSPSRPLISVLKKTSSSSGNNAAFIKSVRFDVPSTP